MAVKRKKSKKKKYKLTHRIAAAITVSAFVGVDGISFAGTTTGRDAVDLSNNLAKSSHGFTTFLNCLSYICGSGLAVTGIYKLKEHSDKPDQVPMRQGVMRLASGGALLSLPFIMRAMKGSVQETTVAVPVAVKMPTFTGAAIQRGS